MTCDECPYQDENGNEIIGSDLIRAKAQAKTMREEISKLTPVEKLMGAKYLTPVLLLIEAIEAI